MLSLQLLLACSLDVLDVVLEILSFYLCAPADCQQDLKNLLGRLGLQDPQGLLYKEMAAWAENFNLDSKATIRTQCHQKLEEIILQMNTLEQSVASVSLEPPREVSSQASLTSGAPLPALSTSLLPSRASEVSLRIHELMVPSPVPSPVGPVVSIQELQAASTKAYSRIRPTKRVLSDVLLAFSSVSEDYLNVLVPPAGKREPSPLEETPPVEEKAQLEETEWARFQIVDLFHIDVLNFFCEKQRAQLQSLMDEEHLRVSPLGQPRPNIVVRPPQDRWLYPILRLQEAKEPSVGRFLRGHRLYRQGPAHDGLAHDGLAHDGSLRVLKLPLPRVELQPFPPGWPAPPRALPPLLLQPTLQRYFLLQDTNPDTYS